MQAFDSGRRQVTKVENSRTQGSNCHVYSSNGVTQIHPSEVLNGTTLTAPYEFSFTLMDKDHAHPAPSSHLLLRSQMHLLLFLPLGITTQALVPPGAPFLVTDRAHTYNLSTYPCQPAMPFPAGSLHIVKSLQYNFSLASLSCTICSML